MYARVKVDRRGKPRWLRFVDKYLPLGLQVWVSQSSYALFRRTKSGFVYSVEVLQWLSGDCDDQLRELWARIHGGPMKRPNVSPDAIPVHHATSTEIEKRWPSLHEWLTSARWEEDGAERQAPTVTIWAQSGQWKLCLRDRDQGLVLWLAAEKLVQLIGLADGLVLAEGAPWRHDDHAHERNGKRVKKSS